LGIDLHLHCDDVAGGPMDVAAAVAAAPADAHLYCCGPAGMMQAFEAAAEARPEDRVHVEYFTAKAVEVPEGGDHAFTVECAKSGKTVEVAADQTILAALEGAGIRVDTSCEDGICGTCETRVLEGVPDHRDSVLTKSEQEAGKTMMVCVSRCRGERLVLDL
jgi:ferredoxin